MDHGLQDEFKRGEKVCNEIIKKESDVDWDKLMEEETFFTKYKNYLQVKTSQCL